MLKNRFFSSLIVIIGGMFASTALANTEEGKTHSAMGKQGDVSFEKVDVNGDGYISELELKDSGAYQVEHSKLDTDNDGRVNQTEFAAFEQMSQQDPAAQDPTQQGTDYQTDPAGESDWQADPSQESDESDY